MGNNIFDGTAYATGTLYVPSESMIKYESAFPWYGWGTIKSLDDLEKEGWEKCPTPVITISDGQFTFGSEMPEAQYHYTITAAGDAEAGQPTPCPTEFTLTVYATAEGYQPSAEASCTLTLANTGKNGDVNGDDAVDVADIIELQNIILGKKWPVVRYGASTAVPTEDTIEA